MNPLTERALMLISQSRFEMAIEELRKQLLSDPNNAQAHSLLAICLVELKQYKEATRSANEGIGLAPDEAMSYFAASIVSGAKNETRLAIEQIEAAIAINPYHPGYFSQLASLKIKLRDWTAAQLAAEKGLELDPEHDDCANLRAIAMVKLGKPIDAHNAIQSAMENSPNDGYSHANLGWSLLEQNKPKEAMPHFREALRLEPEMEWARLGIVEAMKSHFFIYRILLGWLLWMAKLGKTKTWMILIGGYVGYRFAMNVAENAPALRPFVIPLIVLYVGFVVLTWVGTPVFNLLLRFNQFGRMVLNPEEKRISTVIGLLLFIAIGFALGYFVTGQFNYLLCALLTALLMPVVTTYYSSDEGWPRTAHRWMLIGMSVLYLFIMGMVLTLSFTNNEATQEAIVRVLEPILIPSIYLALFGQFAVNYLSMSTPVKGTDTAKKVNLAGAAIVVVLTIGLIFLTITTFLSAPSTTDDEGLPPLRLNLVKSNIDWPEPEKIESMTAKVEALGFDLVGDYLFKEAKGSGVRLMLGEGNSCIAQIYYATAQDLAVNFVQTFEDKTATIIGTGNGKQNIVPKNWINLKFDLRLADLLEKVRDNVQGRERILLKPEVVSGQYERLHALQQDYFYQQGGFLSAEMQRRISRNAESEATEILPIVLYRLHAKALVKVNEFALNKFVDANPEYKKKESDLRVINRFTQLGPEDLSSLLTKRGGNKSAITTDDRVEAFKNNSQNFEYLGTVNSPVRSDIYLEK